MGGDVGVLCTSQAVADVDQKGVVSGLDAVIKSVCTIQQLIVAVKHVFMVS